MAVYAVPIRITWNYGTGSPGANVWHGRSTSEWPPEADGQSMIDALEQFYTDCAGFYPEGVEVAFDGVITGVGLDAGDSAQFPPWTVAGTATGNKESTALQLVVSWGTNSGGRSGRGRTFIGPLSAGIAGADGTPTQGAVDLLQDAAQDLIDASDSFANGAIGVWSPKDQVVRDFVTSAVRRKYGVLRSRRD